MDIEVFTSKQFLEMIKNDVDDNTIINTILSDYRFKNKIPLWEQFDIPMVFEVVDNWDNIDEFDKDNLSGDIVTHVVNDSRGIYVDRVVMNRNSEETINDEKYLRTFFAMHNIVSSFIFNDDFEEEYRTWFNHLFFHKLTYNYLYDLRDVIAPKMLKFFDVMPSEDMDETEMDEQFLKASEKFATYYNTTPSMFTFIMALDNEFWGGSMET